MEINSLITRHDPNNQFNVLRKYHEQITDAWAAVPPIVEIQKSKIKNIIVAGMGGSAISAAILRNMFFRELKIPLFISRNYELPRFAGKDTLLIASSYSGNTEETISSFEDALVRKCQIVALGTGGKLEIYSKSRGIPFFRMRKGFQPRFAFCSNFFTLLKLLQLINLTGNQSVFVDQVIALYTERGDELSAEGNIAMETALSLIGFTPLIYSVQDLTDAVGERLKAQFNENSKVHSFHNMIPEMNHNEIIGWETQREENFRAKVIYIFDREYNPQIKKRFQITSGLIRTAGAEIIDLESQLDDFKLRLMDLVYLGDWISYYLAVCTGNDPTEIKNINILKEKLVQNPD